jgi:hypothetical protein
MHKLVNIPILALTGYWYNKKTLRTNEKSVSDVSCGGLRDYIESRTGKTNYFPFS